jgi:hypothetical protein
MTSEEYENSIREELKHFEPSQRVGRLVLMRETVVKKRIEALLTAERSSKEIKLLENMIDEE